MRSLYAKDNLQYLQKNSTFEQKTRLRSLKQLRQIPHEVENDFTEKSQQHILKALQRKLTKDTQNFQNQQVLKAKNSEVISVKLFSKHGIKEQSEKKLTALKQSNKLFQYFEDLFKKEVPPEKVEREKVNFCQRKFQQIKNTVLHKLESNNKKLKELHQKLTKKYLQVHEYHEQCKQLQMRIQEQKKTKRLDQLPLKSRTQKVVPEKTQHQLKSSGNIMRMSLRPPSMKENILVLQDSIKYLKGQIKIIQQEIQGVNSKNTGTQEEWVVFLKIFINTQYYMSNGFDSVIEEMKKINMRLSKEDLLSNLLDENAKKYFLMHYEKFQTKQKEEKNLIQSFAKSQRQNIQNRTKINSNISIKSLLKDSNLKDIYTNTKEAMVNLVKMQSFKNSPKNMTTKELIFPKIEKSQCSIANRSRVSTLNKSEVGTQKIHFDKFEEQRRNEINRINHLYYGCGEEMEQKGKMMKRILFGFSVK